MWTVIDGKLVYVPVAPQRLALGSGHVEDVVAQIARNHGERA